MWCRGCGIRLSKQGAGRSVLRAGWCDRCAERDRISAKERSPRRQPGEGLEEQVEGCDCCLYLPS